MSSGYCVVVMSVSGKWISSSQHDQKRESRRKKGRNEYFRLRLAPNPCSLFASETNLVRGRRTDGEHIIMAGKERDRRTDEETL